MTKNGMNQFSPDEISLDRNEQKPEQIQNETASHTQIINALGLETKIKSTHYEDAEQENTKILELIHDTEQNSLRSTIEKSCAKCNEPDTKYMIQCSEAKCQNWFHYYCTRLPPYILTTLRDKKQRKFTCENCVLVNDDILEHLQCFEEKMLGSENCATKQQKNDCESELMKQTIDELQEKIINALEKNQADSVKMITMEQKLDNLKSENIALERENIRLEEKCEELNKDYTSIQQAYSKILCEKNDSDTENNKTDYYSMQIEELLQDNKLMKYKYKTMEDVCDSQKLTIDQLHDDLEKRNEISDKYRDKYLQLENMLMNERQNFLDWSLKINKKIESSVKEKLDDLSDPAWTKVNRRREENHQKRKLDNDISPRSFEKPVANEKTPLDENRKQPNDKTILILGNSLINPIDTDQFSQNSSYKVEKHIVYTATEGSKKLDDLNTNYEKILLHLITCDVKTETVENTITNMTTLIDKAHKYTNDIVVSLGPPRSDNPDWQIKTEEVNVQLNSLYHASEHVTINNNANLGNRGRPIKRFYRDDVHLTREGTAVLVSNMKEALAIKNRSFNPRERSYSPRNFNPPNQNISRPRKRFNPPPRSNARGRFYDGKNRQSFQHYQPPNPYFYQRW